MSIEEEIAEINKRLDNIERLVEQQTTNINALTLSTQGIVDVWSAGRTLQKAIKWLSGFSVIAVIIAKWTGKI